MSLQTPGLRHVTAIAGDPPRNAGFYAGEPGSRIVPPDRIVLPFDGPNVNPGEGRSV